MHRIPFLPGVLSLNPKKTTACRISSEIRTRYPAKDRLSRYAGGPNPPVNLAELSLFTLLTTEMMSASTTAIMAVASDRHDDDRIDDGADQAPVPCMALGLTGAAAAAAPSFLLGHC
jgi:hypothetical protein